MSPEPKRATLSRMQLVRAAGGLLALALIVLAVACGSAKNDTDDSTSVPVVGTQASAQKAIQQRSFSLRQQYGSLCLTVPALGENVRMASATPCTGADTQSFSWEYGRFYTSDDACLTFAGAGNQLLAEACNSANANQGWFMREGLVYLEHDASESVMQTGEGSDGNFEVIGTLNFTGSTSSLWTIDTAPQGTPGVLVRNSNAPTNCVALVNSALSFRACDLSDPAQRWNLNNGLVNNQNNCMASVDLNNIVFERCAPADGNAQWWLGTSSDIVSVASGLSAPRTLGYTGTVFSVVSNTLPYRQFGLGRPTP